MKTEAIRECIDYLGPDSGCVAAKNALAELAALEADNARKDAAIIGIIAWAKSESGTLWGDELRRLKSALTGPPSGAFVTLEQLREIEWPQEDSGMYFCPVCENAYNPGEVRVHGTPGNPYSCWIAAKIKEAEDGR